MKEPIPERVEYEEFIYLTSNDLLKKGDWYVDHQKYYLGWNPIEDCDSKSLASFINGKKSGWHSKKIIASNNPNLISKGVKQLL